jgi:methylmalonyl-CoA mutase N-terminal domain/subunit
MMKVQFVAKKPRSRGMRMHVQTSGCTLTAHQPLNNIIRVTLQSLAAVLRRTQSLHTNSFDEALALPSEKAVRVALRTQQIMAHESGVADTIDPLAGSYCVEKLTNEMEARAMEYIDKIDSMGGVIPAIEKGFFQREIADSAYKYQKEIESRERILVGVNEYTIKEGEVPIELLKIGSEVEEEQLKRLQGMKRDRNNRRVKKVLDELHSAAERDENLMPPIIKAVKAYATLGEICNVLRDVFGEYRELIMI